MIRYQVLACDYDGTLAHHGKVSAETYTAIERLKKTGRKFLIVTGRIVDDLFETFPEASIADCIVAENGAVLYDSNTKKTRTLGPPPPEEFVHFLREKRIDPLSIGQVIVATWDPNEKIVREALHHFGLKHHIIFNKGALMVLPPEINKGTGLLAALQEMGHSRQNVVGMGDAENDMEFLEVCGFRVAVANAVKSLKEHADFETAKSHSEGVMEIVEDLISTDLAFASDLVRRRRL